MDIGAETAFDDPLGIAMSWEEKYAKKKEKAPAAEEAAPVAPAATDEQGEGRTERKEPG
jgi:hypothetical protein